MARINHGGPAFPQPGHHADLSVLTGDAFREAYARLNVPQDGMSYRRYLAAKAMEQQIPRRSRHAERGSQDSLEQYCLDAWEWADAMLATEFGEPKANDETEE